uniref:Uncharacterized protein n=1 Tax=Anguilla anguilla TaxID=7936 RepID=A0A0E9W3G7_ANGAN
MFYFLFTIQEKNKHVSSASSQKPKQALSLPWQPVYVQSTQSPQSPSGEHGLVQVILRQVFRFLWSCLKDFKGVTLPRILFTDIYKERIG